MNMNELRDGLDYLMERSKALGGLTTQQDRALTALVKALRNVAEGETVNPATIAPVLEAHRAVVALFPEMQRRDKYSDLGVACQLAERLANS